MMTERELMRNDLLWDEPINSAGIFASAFSIEED